MLRLDINFQLKKNKNTIKKKSQFKKIKIQSKKNQLKKI